MPALIDEALDRTLRIAAPWRRDDDVALRASRSWASGGCAPGSRPCSTAASSPARRLARFLRRGAGGADRPRTPAGARPRGVLAAPSTRAPGGRDQFLADGPVGSARFRVAGVRRAAPVDRSLAALVPAGRFSDRVDAALPHAGRRAAASSSAPLYRKADLLSARRRRAAPRGASPPIAPRSQDTMLAFDRDLNVVLARGVWRLFLDRADASTGARSTRRRSSTSPRRSRAR